MSHESYQDLAEKTVTRMLEYNHKRYKNLLETEKQRLVEYEKRYYKMKKTGTICYKHRNFFFQRKTKISF